MSRAAWKEEGESAALLRNASKNLAYLMERAGVDAAHLSEAIGLGVATINNINAGGQSHLADPDGIGPVFDVKLSDFIEGELGRGARESRAARAVPLVKFTEVGLFCDGMAIEPDRYFVDAAGFDADDAFAVVLNNDALFPSFSQGSVFIVARGKPGGWGRGAGPHCRPTSMLPPRVHRRRALPVFKHFLDA